MGRILVLEDETIVQLLIEEALVALGYDVVGPASNLEEAFALADSCDAAILDVNLGNGATSYPLAHRFVSEGKPFLFMTGYSAASFADFPATPKLSKPFRISSLRKAVAEHLIST